MGAKLSFVGAGASQTISNLQKKCRKGQSCLREGGSAREFWLLLSARYMLAKVSQDVAQGPVCLTPGT